MRSAIVSTWIAVAFDIIAKAKELSIHGDTAASKFALKIEQAIQNSDVRKLQVIESGLLSIANDNLQLFLPHEYEDLKRLQKDRHLCAHPAFAMEEALFQPTPELVRTHITHALMHLLVNAPLQGKSAIARFHADLLSPSFPTDGESIGIFVRAKYLDRAKNVLVANLIRSLLSVFFGKESEKYDKQRHLVTRTLQAIAKAKTAIYDDTVKDYVVNKFGAIPNDLLLSISAFIGCDPRVWEWLPEPMRIQFDNLLQKADIEDLKAHSAFDALVVPELSGILLKRFNSLEQEDQIDIIISQNISQNPRREFIRPEIGIFSNSCNYRTAELLGNYLVIPLAPLMNADEIKTILEAVKKNRQIYEASGTPKVLNQVFDSSRAVIGQTKPYWLDFVVEMTEHCCGNTESYYSYPEIRARLEEL